MRAVIYARLSRKDQRDGDTIEGQIEQCQKLADDNEYEVVQTFIDDGVSGNTLLEVRPGLSEAYKLAQDGGFDRLLMRGVQRFSRTVSKLSVLMATQFEMTGVQLHTVRQGLIDLDNIGELIKFTVDEHASSEYLQTVKKNTSEGRYRRAREGKKMIGRSVAYGYERVRHHADDPKLAYTTLEVIPAQKIVVKRIFREFLKGKTYAEIAAAENDRGTPTHTGRPWEGRYIKNMIARDDYMGTRYYGINKSTTNIDGTVTRWKVPKDDPSVVKQEVEAIIDEATWTRAQIRAESVRRQYSAGKSTYAHEYILRKRITCAQCGGNYHVKTYSKPDPSTWKGFRYRHTEEIKDCVNFGHQLRRDKIEAKVKEALFELSNTDLDDLLSNMKIKYADERETIGELVKARDKEEEKLTKARRLMVDGAFTRDEYLITKREINAELDGINEEIHRIENITKPETLLLQFDDQGFRNQMVQLRELGLADGPTPNWFLMIDENGVMVEVIERADTDLGAKIKVHTVLGSADVNGGIIITTDVE